MRSSVISFVAFVLASAGCQSKSPDGPKTEVAPEPERYQTVFSVVCDLPPVTTTDSYTNTLVGYDLPGRKVAVTVVGCWRVKAAVDPQFITSNWTTEKRILVVTAPRPRFTLVSRGFTTTTETGSFRRMEASSSIYEFSQELHARNEQAAEELADGPEFRAKVETVVKNGLAELIRFRYATPVDVRVVFGGD